MKAGWHTEPMVGFDSETTGLVYDQDWILTISTPLVVPGGRTPITHNNWLVDPGVPVPAGATQINGLTTEYVQTHGMDIRQGLSEAVAYMAAALSTGTPLVGMNLPYDLTMLDRNCRRLGIATLEDVLGAEIAPCIDVLVLDKQLVPKRKGVGARRLGKLCEYYRADPGDAHSSASDALAAVRVAWRLAHVFPDLARLDLNDLHNRQVEWKKTQDASFAVWLHSQGKPPKDCDGQWPIRRWTPDRTEDT